MVRAMHARGMNDRSGRDFLNIPGPTHIPERVLNAMHRQSVDVTDPGLVEIGLACLEDLKSIFRTDGRVFIYASNGHGAWEAVLANLFEPGELVLVPETGVFSNSWADHAEALDLKAELLPGDWRHAIDAGALEERLRADKAHAIKAVLAVHTDTATGLASDIPAVRAALDAAGHPALLVVDAIASLGAVPFDMRAWGVNAALGASQKALMGPPGLAFVAADPRALETARNKKTARRYWDWEYRQGEKFYKNFCGTPPMQHLFALREGLDIIAEQGLERIFRRHERLAGAVHRAIEVWSEAGALSFNARRPQDRSKTVTTLLLAEGLNGEDLRRHTRETYGLVLGGGLGPLEGKAFRIGHMGDINDSMILGCLATLEAALVELAIPHGAGGTRAAIEYVAAERAADKSAAAAAE